MRPIIRITAFALLGVAFSAVAMQHTNYRYRWVDATGLPHYSDSLTVKAVKFGYDVLGPDGDVIRHVAGVVTPAERKAAAAKLARQQTIVNQQQHDRELLTAYPTEAAYKAALQARIEQVDGLIHTTRLNLDSQEQYLAQMLASAADYTRENKSVPRDLDKHIAGQRQIIMTQRQLLAKQQVQRTQAQQQVSVKLAHYRKLVADQQAGNNP
ncbi:MAG TPA: DUF4124 domain-containing protein [Rhodanobacteraceae bacterium]